MLRPWYQNGKKIYADGRPVYCAECPCEPATTCQCVFHYYACWCKGYEYPPDPPIPGEYLDIDQVRACFPAWSIIGVTEHIFRFLDEAGDGCFETFGGIEEGWADWCALPLETETGCKEPGGDAFCPVGVLPILAVHTGPVGCTPCDETTSGCARPTGFPGLPSNPETLGGCA